MANRSNKVQITVSRKSEELRTQYIMRVNKTTDLKNFATTLGTKVSSRTIRGGAKLLPKIDGQAQAVNKTVYTRPGSYRTGDGDLIAARRPGCDDHLKYKSLGLLDTAVYHDRGHE